MVMDPRERRFVLQVFLFFIFSLVIVGRAEDSGDYYSRSVANFLRIQEELKNQHGKSAEETVPKDVERRADVLNPAHEGWNGHWFNHLKTQEIPDFGHHELHSMDEHGEELHLDSKPRHHVYHGDDHHHHHHHHMPHYHHEVHTFHHDGEHPHMDHEHYVHHEPIYHDVPIMHYDGHHHGHHYDGHHHGHHDDDEESGDHEEHHEEEAMHGDTEDWDVGGGYFQLEEHGSDVNVVALKKHGTKVHMGGGDFNVIRDPWRHHSLFAGLFHPHEMPGHGHFPMEQFHQHFTYIANDRAINHHVYEHHTHNEDHHIHEHDPGHEHDYFYHHPPEPNNHGGKREYTGSSPINITAKAQVKQEISDPAMTGGDVITIPLSFSKSHQQPSDTGSNHNVVPMEVPDSDSIVKSQIFPSNSEALDFNRADSSSPNRNTLPVIEVDDPVGKSEMKVVKEKKELPKGKTPHLSPFNGNRIGPKDFGKEVEMPFAPIFKRDVSGMLAVVSDKDHTKSEVFNENPSRKSHDKRSLKLKRAFLGKLLLSRSSR